MKETFKKESKLIEIGRAKRVIFVGDTHGDLEASQKVIGKYLKPGNKIVFLGDYVDRGQKSKENLKFLLETKLKHPNQIYLLQGNHEGYKILKFSPADFWESLSKEEYQKYSQIVEKFPLAVVVKDIIALHGALPKIERLEDFEKIKIGDENWIRICWGDFVEENGEYLEINPFTGRPQFGRNYFFKIMQKINKKILIRSHDPKAPRFMYNDLCLTIFTSSAYTEERIIAIADFSREIKTARDLEIRRV
jgi:predicted MPP superfamily phosphohydrolase